MSAKKVIYDELVLRGGLSMLNTFDFKLDQMNLEEAFKRGEVAAHQLATILLLFQQPISSESFLMTTGSRSPVKWVDIIS